MPKKEKTASRSRQAMKEAFLQLLAEKPYGSITVQNILDRSGYSRGTFYSHFMDKEDLVRQLVADEVALYGTLSFDCVGNIHKRQLTRQEQDCFSRGVQTVFQHVYEERELYRRICEGKLPGLSLHRFGDLFYRWGRDRAKITAEPPQDGLDLDLYLHQMAHTRTLYIEYWIQNDFAQAPQYMAEQLAAFCRFDLPVTVQKRDGKPADALEA